MVTRKQVLEMVDNAFAPDVILHVDSDSIIQHVERVTTRCLGRNISAWIGHDVDKCMLANPGLCFQIRD